MSGRYEVSLDGKTYVWNGKVWYDSKTFATPPLTAGKRLNGMAASKFAGDDSAITSPSALMDQAKLARDNEQFSRAESLLRRVLQSQPGNEGALAILSSVLREQGRAEDALTETERCDRSTSAPLRTSRAAAQCDLDRWEAARKEIAVVLATGNHPEAFSVVNRIKAARPDLTSEF